MTLKWGVIDATAGVASSTGCDAVTVTGDLAATTYACSGTDNAGNTSKASVTIKRDSTPPALSPTGLTNGQVLAVGQTAPAVSPGASDVTSGVATAACTPAATTTVGTGIVTCTATDFAGNTASTTITYYITAGFAGFTAPLPRTTQNAGSTVPVKFTLTNWAGTSKITTGTFQAILAPAGAPGTAATSATCAYTVTSGWQCNLKMAATAGTYQIQIWQHIGTIWHLVANAQHPASTNPGAIVVR